MKKALRTLAVAFLLAVIVVAAGAVGFLKLRAPTSIDRPPALANVPPLPPVTRTSLIVTPVVIPIDVIQAAIERAVPPSLSGKPDLPAPPGTTNTQMSWSLSREPFKITGGPQGLTLASSFSGSLRARGEMVQPNAASMPPGSNARGGPQGSFTGPPGFPPRPPGLPMPPGDFGPPGMGPPGMGPPGTRLPGMGPPGMGPPGMGPPSMGPPSMAPPSMGPPPGGSADRRPAGPSSTPSGPQASAPTNDPMEQQADFRGTIALTTRPHLLPAWRLEPNITSQINVDTASAQIMGMPLNLPQEIKPLIGQFINDQISRIQALVADSPAIEQAARTGWSNMCRSVPLRGKGPDGPSLWLELRPAQALASQPRIAHSALTFAIGVRAETRIVPSETKPDCVFPSEVDIVPQMDEGRVNIDVPIDIPFAEVSRQIETQIKGKTFPVDESGAVKATVRSVKLGASGDRLLIALELKVNETKSWFGLDADATLYVWGRPRLDRANRRLRFDDVALDVQSEAAFGILGLVARAAVPNLQKTLADNAEIDLAPLVTGARENLAAAMSEIRRNASGIDVNATVTEVRLAAVQFDASTLRVVAEADGTIRVEVTDLGPLGDGSR